MAKRICLFLDGSAASAALGSAQEFSNVFRLNLAIHFEDETGVPQQAIYFTGVGTRGDKVSGASGKGLNQIISEAYVNLSSNYMQGDQIYIFGWSRGAAAARAIAGLISKVGLLGADYLHYLDKVWQLYRLRQKRERSKVALSEDDNKAELHLRRAIEGKLWIGDSAPTIRLLGLFDTVPGNSWDRFRAFTDIDFYVEKLERSVDVGIQLLSIDDRRHPTFCPLLWRGLSRPGEQILEQIWMPGVHADVGGNSGCGFLADLALLTMIDRVREHCPELHFAQWNLDVLGAELLSHAHVGISDETSGLSRWLRRRVRTIGSIDPRSEYLHPITDVLENQRLRIRRREAAYKRPQLASELPAGQLGALASGIWGLGQTARPYDGS